MNRIFVSFLLMASIFMMTGCTFINEENFGMRRTWDNQIEDQPRYGMNQTFIGSIKEVSRREFILPVENVRPKDKLGIMLDDLDVVFTMQHIPEGAIAFYKERGDMYCPEMLTGCIIGFNYLKKDAAANIGNSIRVYDSVEILDKRKAVEETLRNDFQKELDTLYGDNVFKVKEAKIATVQVAKSVEERIQAVALIASEKERSKATLEVLATRKETYAKEFATFKDAAQTAGITFNQALEYRRLDILRDLPSGSNVTLNVEASGAKE